MMPSNNDLGRRFLVVETRAFLLIDGD